MSMWRLPHGLKINISVNLAILLAMAMLLLDLVMVISAEKILINAEIRRADLLLSAIGTHLPIPNEAGKKISGPAFEETMEHLLHESGFSCAVVLDRDAHPTYSGGTGCLMQERLGGLARESMNSGRRSSRSFGAIWGVFWKQRQFLILSTPFRRNGEIVGAGGILLPLEKTCLILRNTQHILLVYIFVNTIALTFVGLHRLSKTTVRPLHSLLRRAEDYREETDFCFLGEKGNNEFSELSKALNRMLKRISDDKRALRLTVQSLEKANAEIRQAQRDIIRAEKLASAGRLSSGIAHEIGNPLAIVIGYFDLLKRKDLSVDEKEAFLARAENEVSRINRIIRRLLDFSGPSDGTLRRVSVHGLIEDLATMLQYQPLMSDIRLSLSLCAEMDRVMADPDQLRQVFLNLAINAADAIASVENQPDGQILISSELSLPEVSGDHPLLKLTFADNGPGMAEEVLANMFDPFYTTKEPGKGTGLGLSVSFMIIDAIDGKIEAASDLEKGATMTIFLPVIGKG